MPLSPREHEHTVRYAVDGYRVVECDTCRGQPYALQERDHGGRRWLTLRFDADLLRLRGLMMARSEERQRLRARVRAAQRT